MKLKTLIRQLATIEEKYGNLEVLRPGHVNGVGFTRVDVSETKVMCSKTQSYVVIR